MAHDGKLSKAAELKQEPSKDEKQTEGKEVAKAVEKDSNVPKEAKGEGAKPEEKTKEPEAEASAKKKY